MKDIISGGENGITNKTIKEEVNKFNKSENIYLINQQIKNVIRELNDNFIADNIIFGIKEEDFNLSEEEDEEDDDDSDDEKDNINPSYIIKMLYILYKDKKLMPLISSETKQLINYFTIKKTNINQKSYVIQGNKNFQINELNKKLINELEVFGQKIQNNKIHDDNFKNMINQIARFIQFLKIYNVILIPFLGESNVGKSTIINGIIGKEILPTYSNECTKRGIIIKYINSDETFIYKAKFKEEKDILGNINYFFSVIFSNDLIGKGLEQVKDTLKGLNYQFNEKEEDSFYYIKTKIKLFDEMELNESLKEMIILIDFPGFGTGNIFEKKKIYEKVMSICNSFTFVVRNSLIRENTTQNRLKSLFDLAQMQKKKFSTQFLKSSLFILNNDKDQSKNEEDLNLAKIEFQKILEIDKEDINNIKLCFFNAKYYENYINNYNYFYNINDLFNNEYEEYKNRKRSFFKNPLSYRKREDQEFFDLLYNNLRTKIKEIYEVKNIKIALKKQQIKENIKEDLIKNVDEINNEENLNYGKLPEMKDKLLKIISFGQDHISELKSLQESNINKFNESLKNQINYINSVKQEDLGEEMENVINLLDNFFKRDFQERKKDLNEIKNLKKLQIEIQKKNKNFLDSCQKLIIIIKKEFKTKIKQSLILKKNDLEIQLINKNYNIILEEIRNQIRINLIGLNERIGEYIIKVEQETNSLSQYRKELITKFNFNYKEKKSFNSYIIKKIGTEKKDLEEQVFNELKSSCNSLNILFKKGIKDFFNSLFSDLTYLENIIDILIDTSLKKINFVLELIENESIELINKYYYEIMLFIKMACMEFTDEQKRIWKGLCNLYENTRKQLINSKNEILKILKEKK